jgi:hypothetical protein
MFFSEHYFAVNRSCYAVASDTTNNAISDQSSMKIKHIKRVLQVCVCGVSGTREG